MRLLSHFILPALCWRLAAAVDSVAHVYIYNPDQPQRPGQWGHTYSPSAARLVLAQMAGVEEFHSSDLPQKEVLTALNGYGLETSLFSEPRRKATSRALLFVEADQEYLRQQVHAKLFTEFSISNEPSSVSANELFHDLQVQSDSLNNQNIEFTSFLEDQDFRPTIERLKEAGNTAFAILYVPPTPRPYGAGAEWGTYRMPTSLLTKRQRVTEEPLEELPSTAVSPAQTSTPKTHLLLSSPLPGILPACFPSLSSCNELTRNCTGHGSCSLKYTDTSSDAEKRCYSCQCSPSVKKDEEGRVSTTYWGGPACQKRDVSVQFWLIALFVVAMAGLVSFAVGSVWSMGDEELPSVIGAGVSGPVARR